MKIVIAGAGEVGMYLAKFLSREDQDIMLIDKDSERLNRLDANYNLMTVTGDPTTFEALREASAGSADLFIAVTPYETDNIVACATAKSLGAKTTVARIERFDFMDERNRPFVNRMGVDRVIYPEYLAASEILRSMDHAWTRSWYELHNGEIILVGVTVTEDAPMCGMSLRDLSSAGHSFHVSAIRRNHETIIPRGNDIIEAEDIMYITSTSKGIRHLMEMTGNEETRLRSALIMGGSKIAVRLLNLANGRYRFTVVEPDRKRCEKISMLCPNAEIIQGDARDPELLAEAGITDTDVFIALTDSSESNILSCLTAREAGVMKTVAEVENIQFIPQAEGLNIGTIINKKLLASSSIFQLLLDTDHSTSKCLAIADAEVAEMVIKVNSKLTKGAVKDLKLPRELTLAAMIRQGKGMLISGTTELMPGDSVLVFCLRGALKKVEKLFN